MDGRDTVGGWGWGGVSWRMWVVKCFKEWGGGGAEGEVVVNEAKL